MKKTKIEWCDSTWNPVTGCYHGCEYCYARKIAARFGGWYFTPGKIRMNIADDKTYIHPMAAYYGEANETENGVIAAINDPFENKSGKKAPYPFGFTPTFHKYRLDEPTQWEKPRNIFVCSMADLFGEWVPDKWIEEVFATCERAPQHRYLFLTKNPDRYAELARAGKLPQRENMLYGSTLDSMSAKRYPGRFSDNTFVSIEPLTEYMDVGLGSFGGDKWIIIGAETGNRKGKVIPKKEWVDKICAAADITRMAVFMKDSLIPIVCEENMRREFPWAEQEGERQ